MLSHVNIGVRHFKQSLAFYKAIMPVAGWKLKFVEEERPWAGWQPEGSERPLLIVGVPFDGHQAEPGNGNMIGFQVAARSTVDAVFEIAMANGATSEGQPGLRPEYHENYYGAYVRDLDGNKLCFCCHSADSALNKVMETL